MPGERAIHVTMFVLILIGLCSLSAWISYKFLEELILQVAAIALSWGVTLLVLYIGFKVLGWDWWSEHAPKKQANTAE
jgi:nitrogen fixation protein